MGLLILGGIDAAAGLSRNSSLLIDARPGLRKQILADPSVLNQARDPLLRSADYNIVTAPRADRGHRVARPTAQTG